MYMDMELAVTWKHIDCRESYKPYIKPGEIWIDPHELRNEIFVERILCCYNVLDRKFDITRITRRMDGGYSLGLQRMDVDDFLATYKPKALHVG